MVAGFNLYEVWTKCTTDNGETLQNHVFYAYAHNEKNAITYTTQSFLQKEWVNGEKPLCLVSVTSVKRERSFIFPLRLAEELAKMLKYSKPTAETDTSLQER